MASSVRLKVIDDVGIKTGENLVPEQSGIPMGGTELMANALFSRLDPELRDHFQFILSRKRELEDKPKIFWAHDLALDPEAQFLKSKEGIDLFEKVVFVSNWQQYQYHAYLGVPYEKSVVVQNAIEPIPSHEKPKEGKLRVAYTSTPHRGLEVLLDAWEAMDRDDAELHVYSSFKIYARPWMDEQYRHLYDKCNCLKNVVYHGTVSNDQIREDLQKTHILAYPSVYQETSCLAVIEAMSAGCAVVCPNLGALPETCANFGFMYNWNPDKKVHGEIHAAILSALIDQYWDERIQGLVEIQKSYFDMWYSWDLRIQQWNELLTSLKEREQ